MFRVVCVVDKKNTALDRLAKGVRPYHTNLDYHVVDVHPKRPSPEQLQKFEELAKSADIIDYQYFRSAELLRNMYPWLKEIPSILTHNNPYSIKESDWNSYQVNVGNNTSITKELREITTTRVEYIPLVVDPYFWEYNNEYTYSKSVIMVANRIESKKGILPVAQACAEIGAKMYLVGAISDPEYWGQVMATGVVEFAQEVSDELLRELYHKSGVHVCNSVDNFESGTLPILEAIFCGVPVLARNVGHVPDIRKDGNIKLQEGSPEDVERIANLLTVMFADRKVLEKMRSDAWVSIKDRNFERRAYTYQRLYRELLAEKPVTVIMPVADKPELTSRSVNAVLAQNYKNIELIVIDDGDSKQGDTINSLRRISQIPFRYIALDQVGYNLAKARNIGAIEATSDILVFCDQRMVMEEDCVHEFVTNLKPRAWLYGSKDGVEKDFIENLSCVSREDFVTFGMFNERCDRYGALSQETRSRARRQGMNLELLKSAKATTAGKSSNRSRKRIEIMESKNMLWKVNLQ